MSCCLKGRKKTNFIGNKYSGMNQFQTGMDDFLFCEFRSIKIKKFLSCTNFNRSWAPQSPLEEMEILSHGRGDAVSTSPVELLPADLHQISFLPKYYQPTKATCGTTVAFFSITCLYKCFLRMNVPITIIFQN